MEPQPYPAHGCLLLATAVDRDLPARQVLHRAAAALARAGTADLAGKAVLKGETRANPEVRGEAHLMFRYGFGGSRPLPDWKTRYVLSWLTGDWAN